MKLTLNVLENHSRDTDKQWPNYMFGGRVRTSTLVLIIAFLATWWTYNTYKPQPAPPPAAPAVVPPGFVPDPNYTWVPRTRVQQPTYDTPTPTPTPTTTVPTTTPPTTPPTTTTPPPLIQLPVLPPPFGPGTTTPSPAPGPAPESPTPSPSPALGLPGLPGLPG
jgi:hypothetical protein